MRVRASIIVLVAANLVPLLGVLFWGWQVFLILALFWLENIIIGLLNVPRLLFAQGDHEARFPAAKRLGLSVFFAFHYGFFTVAHGVFIFSVFGAQSSYDVEYDVPGVLRMIIDYQLYWALIALFFSHMVSLWLNYFASGEFQHAKVKKMMHRPYKRVVILHMTIIFGGFLLQASNEPVAGLLVLLVIKTIVDVVAHQKERKVMGGEDIMRDPLDKLF